MCAVCRFFETTFHCATCDREVCLDTPSSPDDPVRDSLCVGFVWNPLLCQRCDDIRCQCADEDTWLAILERRV